MQGVRKSKKLGFTHLILSLSKNKYIEVYQNTYVTSVLEQTIQGVRKTFLVLLKKIFFLFKYKYISYVTLEIK